MLSTLSRRFAGLCWEFCRPLLQAQALALNLTSRLSPVRCIILMWYTNVLTTISLYRCSSTDQHLAFRKCSLSGRPAANMRKHSQRDLADNLAHSAKPFRSDTARNNMLDTTKRLSAVWQARATHRTVFIRRTGFVIRTYRSQRFCLDHRKGLGSTQAA